MSIDKSTKRSIRKNYRIRPDIAAELDGLVKLLNQKRPADTVIITETFIIESAIVAYVKTIKRGLESISVPC